MIAHAALAVALVVVAADKAPIIAVFEIEDATARLTASELEQLTTYLAASLAKTKAFEVVPRANMKQALRQEQAESFRACYDEACQIEIGKEVAAQKVLVTKLIQVGNSCAITSTLIDLTKATSERAATARSDCSVDAIVDGIESVVRDLDPKSAAPPPPPLVVTPPPPPPPKVEAGRWKLTSKPEGAAVRIDGKEVGRTPLELEEKNLGPKRVELLMDGRMPYEAELDVRGGEETRVHATLVSQAEIDAIVASRGDSGSTAGYFAVGAFAGALAGIIVVALAPTESSIRANEYESYLSSRLDPVEYGAVEDRVALSNTMTVTGWVLISAAAVSGVLSVITLAGREPAPETSDAEVGFGPIGGAP